MGKNTKSKPSQTLNKYERNKIAPANKKRQMRDPATAKRLLMYTKSKPIRDSKGRITKAAPYQQKIQSGAVARTQPSRTWFGNTRYVAQEALQTFQSEMSKAISDPYRVVMRQTRMPISLLKEVGTHKRTHILDRESFACTFGPSAQRKRANIGVASMEEFGLQAEKKTREFEDVFVEEEKEFKEEASQAVVKKGQSRRIWNELFKVVDSSDVILQILDARDPMGTRSTYIEKYLKKEKPFKHLVFVLNKCDLVPTWVTKRWVTRLSSEYPTLAFRASISKCFGKTALMQLLRQFAKLHNNRKQISVGLVGYPNSGKSSVINALLGKKVCKAAPIAGETKVWQYVSLMKKIYLIDCPGVVYPSGESETDIILKGVVRVETLVNPDLYAEEVIRRVEKKHLQNAYGVMEWDSELDFMEKMAKKSGKLIKNGEADITCVSKMLLNDWIRGKLPYFHRPPNLQDEQVEENDTKVEDSENKVEDSENKVVITDSIDKQE